MIETGKIKRNRGEGHKGRVNTTINRFIQQNQRGNSSRIENAKATMQAQKEKH